jgi:hypothetical protein
VAEGIGTKLLAVSSALSTILLAWIGFAVKRQETTSQMALAELAEGRQRLSAERDVHLKVYEAVVGALQDSAPRRQEIARSLVYALVRDSAFQEGLIQALRQEAVPAVQRVIERDIAFDDSLRQSRVAALTLPKRGGISRLDLFWCEAGGAAARKPLETARDRLVQAGYSQGTVRVRSLPASVNARPGYQVSGYQVRFEADEREAGRQIADVLGKVTEASVALKQIPAQTPGYVSAFACP